MNEREQVVLSQLLASKKYGQICPDAVVRIFEQELARHRTTRDADKAARAHLHQISGAFLAGERRQAGACLQQYLAGDETALAGALRLHASTRERLQTADELYARVLRRIGTPGRVLDLACGLNPLYLGAKGIAVSGYDIHGSLCALVNEWARACAWDVRAECCDLIQPPALPAADLALLMKLLPVLEQQKKGAALALLSAVPARYILVSFPTRTLSGRAVGMAQNYARWFSQNRPEALGVLDEFELGNELCYLLEGRHG